MCQRYWGIEEGGLASQVEFWDEELAGFADMHVLQPHKSQLVYGY